MPLTCPAHPAQRPWRIQVFRIPKVATDQRRRVGRHDHPATMVCLKQTTRRPLTLYFQVHTFAAMLLIHLTSARTCAVSVVSVSNNVTTRSSCDIFTVCRHSIRPPSPRFRQSAVAGNTAASDTGQRSYAYSERILKLSFQVQQQ